MICLLWKVARDVSTCGFFMESIFFFTQHRNIAFKTANTDNIKNVKYWLKGKPDAFFPLALMLPNDHEYIVPNTAGANDLNVRYIKCYEVSTDIMETCFTCFCYSTDTPVMNL